MLETALIVAAAAAGVTGAWSPCGFSMVETLAPQGYAGRLRTTVAAGWRCSARRSAPEARPRSPSPPPWR